MARRKLLITKIIPIIYGVKNINEFNKSLAQAGLLFLYIGRHPDKTV